MSRGWKLTGTMTVAAGLLGLVVWSCITPPAVMEAGSPAIDLATFPPGTELVELPVEGGAVLRGVFVPGPPAAPVVLHLLEAMGSISFGGMPMGTVYRTSEELVAPENWHAPPSALPMLDPEDGLPRERNEKAGCVQYNLVASLRALGFSTLIVDYEGVGASSGERSPLNLRRDARAAWDEAVRRAGGDPRRVVLRGTSLGSLAAATLLADGVEPAAVTLLAPVRAESVTENFARPDYGDAVAAFAGWFLRDPVDVDLLATLEALHVPLLVVVPADDFLLPEPERALLEQSVASAGGTLIARHEGHVELSIASRDLLCSEVGFYERELARWIPDREAAAVTWWREHGADPATASALDAGAPAAERLRAVLRGTVPPSPGLAAMLAVSDLSDVEICDLAVWAQWLPPRVWSEADASALRAFASLDDPAGRMPSVELRENLFGIATLSSLAPEELRRWVCGPQRLGEITHGPGGINVDMRDGSVRLIDRESQVRWIPIFLRDFGKQRRQLSRRDAERQAVRLTLRMAGIPERLGPDWSCLEIWQRGLWRDLDLPAPGPTTSGAEETAPPH
jgi:dienelactone hydrolase